jgi:hypothetical protein
MGHLSHGQWVNLCDPLLAVGKIKEEKKKDKKVKTKVKNDFPGTFSRNQTFLYLDFSTILTCTTYRLMQDMAMTSERPPMKIPRNTPAVTVTSTPTHTHPLSIVVLD